MQDFGNPFYSCGQRVQYPSHLPNVFVSPPLDSFRVPGDFKAYKKHLIQSPERMYMYSLSTHEKLPEDLHEAMLLWSFDSKQSFFVKSYLEWVEMIERHHKSRMDLERASRTFDRILFSLLIVTGLAIGTAILFSK